MSNNGDTLHILISAVISWDHQLVRNLLDENQEFSFSSRKNLLHVICNESKKSEGNCEQLTFFNIKKSIIYMLVDAGVDLEQLDEAGNTCLFYVVKNEDCVICDVLLQCGADMWAETEDGAMLKDIALSTGNEEIINLILGIFDSMKLIYHIFAKNVKAVRLLLETNHQRVRLDLRKMSDRGAPIIYYLIQSEEIAIIELFIHHGCQLYTIMQDDLGLDMPVLFSALKAETPVNVVEALLPPCKPLQEEMLYKILYRGYTVLEVALAENVNLEVFSLLIDRGGPLLLCERNQMNQTVRDLAIASCKEQYLDIIDSSVSSWILYPWKYPGRRLKLALYGWNLEAIEEELKRNLYVDDYFVHHKPLQIQMKQLADAIEKGDMKTFLEIESSLSELDDSANFLWHGRVVDDGMPHLHRAVLHNQLKMVEIILSAKPSKESIDNLFDQNRRTALHYAYASASMKEIRKLLMTYGCSEHVLDKINREPLDFRDKQDSPDMIQLLHRLKSKDFSWCENDPWRNERCVDESSYSEEEQSADQESELSEEDEMIRTRSCAIS
ncbi:putative ankyrin repeat protein-like protein [Argiope bruennichi]|uniref:Alpha-latrotoxin n=1 Tax=Argiope bruennichi TaxID=94029 RepID=A0A8T0EB54_ARGBR|nr:putative ankyrin repeat protein-like protein [Argiope bruennichi]